MTSNEFDSQQDLHRKAIGIINEIFRPKNVGAENKEQPLDFKGIADRIAFVATAIGSKKKLAELVGISEMQLYRYLNNQNAPSIEVVERIARAVNVPPEWLAFGVGTPNRAIDFYMENFIDHLKQLEKFDWSLKRISSATGIPESDLNLFITKAKRPSMDILLIISAKTPISLDYLMTGNFPPFKAFSPDLKGKSIKDLRLEFESIPLFDPQSFFNDDEYPNQTSKAPSLPVLLHREWITYNLKCNPKDLVLMNVFDHMMSPTIATGDVVLLDTRYEHLDITEGIYVMKYKGGIVLRRINHFHDGTTSIGGDSANCEKTVVKSENLRKNVKIVGKVVWHGHIS